ncbi:MAG: hypothetical protein K1060chlam5_01369 [Candidatus Anoxychlamydiales bacterium]|nr:hypothetical protein [Candidatus Anoxychlamydiales bacterium]
MNEKVETINEVDETSKAKKLEALYLSPPFQNLHDYKIDPSIQITKRNLSSISQVSKSDDLSISSNPGNIDKKHDLNIEKSTKSFSSEIADAIARNEDIIYDIIDLSTKNINFEKKEIKELTDKEKELLKKRLQELSKRETIDVYKNILLTVSAATTIVIGSLIISPEAIGGLLLSTAATNAATLAASNTSAIWGYLLVASGLSNILTNDLVAKTNTFENIGSFFTNDPKRASEIGSNIKNSINIASTITSLACSIATSNFVSSIIEWGTSFKILDVATTLSSGSANYLSHSNQATINNLNADQTLIKKEMNFHNFLFDKNLDDLKNIAELNETFNRMSFNIFQTLIKINDQSVS